MLLSADDLLVPGALARAVSVLDEFPDVVLSRGAWIVWDGSPPAPDPSEQPGHAWVRQAGMTFIEECCASGENFVRTPTVVARTSVQKSIGGYRAELPHSGDMEMWMRFAAHGVIARTNAVQAIYRQHSTNMSFSYCFDYLERKAAFDVFFSENSDRIADCQAMRERADRALAEHAYWTGAAQLCRGNVKRGRWLLRFAVTLRPELRYRPPLQRVARLPDLHKRMRQVLNDGLQNLLRSRGQELGSAHVSAGRAAGGSGAGD